MYHFKSLAREGELGPIYLTMQSERVLEIIGEPDFRGGQSNRYKWGNVWRYGDLEFVFENDNRCLAHITVNFSVIDNEMEQGLNFRFDPWIFKSTLTLPLFIEEMKNEKVGVLERKKSWNEGCIEILTEGEMLLIFGRDNKLCKLCVSEHVDS